MQKSVVFRANFLVVFIGIQIANTSSSLISTNMDLCGYQTELKLTGQGETSSMIITLQPIEQRTVCKLHVTAPKTHTVSMDFIENSDTNNNNNNNNNNNQTDDNRQEDRPPCVMSIILPENPRIPVWKGDPCSNDPVGDVDLLTSDFKIIWTPPSNRNFTKGRKFVLTAVGQGAVCKEPGQHTCMKIGWDPMLCISDYLLCDGIRNCPKSSTSSDEDEKLCKQQLYAQTTWEQIAVEIFKKFRSTDLINNNKWLHDKLDENGSTTKKTTSDWNDWEEIKAIETTTKKVLMDGKKKATDSISQVLSKYGPWGYLMLGMLICGTVLMFCGLWECCFRRPKSPMETTPSRTQPTTVLIINQQDEVVSPPNYDDLDQPPAYTTLFPNYKPNNVETVENEQEANGSDDHTTNNDNECGGSTSGSQGGENQQEQEQQQQQQEQRDCDAES